MRFLQPLRDVTLGFIVTLSATILACNVEIARSKPKANPTSTPLLVPAALAATDTPAKAATPVEDPPIVAVDAKAILRAHVRALPSCSATPPLPPSKHRSRFRYLIARPPRSKCSNALGERS